MLKAAASKLYNEEILIEKIDSEKLNEQFNHIRFILKRPNLSNEHYVKSTRNSLISPNELSFNNLDNTHKIDALLPQNGIKFKRNISILSYDEFSNLQPFHLCLDENLNIIGSGYSIQSIIAKAMGLNKNQLKYPINLFTVSLAQKITIILKSCRDNSDNR